MSNSAKKTQQGKPQILRIPIARWYDGLNEQRNLQALMATTMPPLSRIPRLPKQPKQTMPLKRYKSHKPQLLQLPFEPNCESLPNQAKLYATSLMPMPPLVPFLENQIIEPRLQNIVATVNLCCNLDLKRIALHARNAEYNPKRFAAVIMRIRKPPTTALIFDSGKMICTGAKNVEDSRIAARKYARIVQKIGYPAKFMNFKIQNIVGSFDVRFPIRLESLALVHGNHCSYEPELYPGLIYRMVRPRVILLIFVSGKVVLTGGKVRKDIDDAFDKILPILKMFRKKPKNAILPGGRK